MNKKKLRIAALADLHVGKQFHEGMDYHTLFADIGKNADVFLMCGDLTDHGLSNEAEELVDLLKACPIPKLAVLGNHDFARDQQEDIKKILKESDIHLLQEEIYQIDDIGFAGVKGFGGGYGQHTLGAFGEPLLRKFVGEAINEVEQLEIALDNIGQMNKKVVLLHYSPITQTNHGEPLEIYPFLGTSRLEDVLDRHTVSVAFHGHAHFGSHHGITVKGIDVYNVSYLVMLRQNPHKPYKLYEL